jgi:hypothetical protein
MFATWRCTVWGLTISCWADLAVGEPVRQQLEHLALASRQQCRRRLFFGRTLR